MSNADSSFNTLRFDAVTQKLQYVVGSTWVDVPTAAGGVTSVTGTTHQIVSSPSTGAVVLSLPSVIAPAVDSAQAFNFTEADGTTTVLDISTTNRRVGINTTTPSQPLEVDGNVAIDGQLVMGGGSPSGACLIDMNNIYVGLGLTVLTAAQMAAVTPNRMGNILWNSTANALYGNNGTSWAPIGGVANVQQATSEVTDLFETTSAVLQDTGFGVTITPTSVSAKILLTFSVEVNVNGSESGYLTIYRGVGGTNLGGGSLGILALTQPGHPSQGEMITMTIIDSPSTTSPVVYELYMSSENGIDNVRLNDDGVKLVAIAQQVA